MTSFNGALKRSAAIGMETSAGIDGFLGGLQVEAIDAYRVGMSSFLTDQPLNSSALLAEVASTGHGASVLFLGTVRNSPEDGDIEGIEYSAYPEMAEGEFGRIVAEAVQRWPQVRVSLRHRTGYIPKGEASIAIAVAAPHRAEAYDCSRYLIEETKKRVPVWKKERLASGETRWVEPAGRT